MGSKGSKQENKPEIRSTTATTQQPIALRPEAQPETGVDYKVTLPNGNTEICRVYTGQTAGEFKIECLTNQNARPDNIEVVLIDNNLQEMVLKDNEDLKERLTTSHDILLRPRGPTGDNEALRSAIHLR